MRALTLLAAHRAPRLADQVVALGDLWTTWTGGRQCSQARDVVSVGKKNNDFSFEESIFWYKLITNNRSINTTNKLLIVNDFFSFPSLSYYTSTSVTQTGQG